MTRRLSGSYSASMDEKGRVHVPSVLNRQFGEDDLLMVSVWGNSLAAFPMPHYDYLSDQLFELRKDPSKREQVNRIVAGFYPGTFKGGKLLIPQEIRNKFPLDRKLQVVGLMDHIQIWNQADWQSKETLEQKRSSQDDLSDLGLF